MNIIVKKSPHLLRYNLFVSRDAGVWTNYAFGPAENPYNGSISMFYDSGHLFSYKDNYPFKKKSKFMVHISGSEWKIFKGYGH